MATKKKTKKTAKKAAGRKKATRKAAAKAEPRGQAAGSDRVFFVTGYPGFIGKRLVEALSRRYPGSTIYVLVQEKFEGDARGYVDGISAGVGKASIHVLVGDIVDMDLGLSGEEVQTIVDTVTDVFHLAAIYYLGVRKEHARRVNVDGTRRVLELCREMKKLRRLNHMSTAWVCGDRVGVIGERELEMGQRFRNAYEETKYESEVMVEDAKANLPVTIFRPSIVVGDSRTGEIDKFDGPYYLGILMVTSPLRVPLPLPDDGVAPLNVVPVDFVVNAMIEVNENPLGEGKTLHLTDPNPMSGRQVYERIAERSGKRLPRIRVSARLTDAVMRLPLIEKILRQQRQAVNYVNHLAIFNCHNTLELLDGTGVRCPPLESYLDTLIDYVQAWYRRREDEGSDVEDPLDALPPTT